MSAISNLLKNNPAVKTLSKIYGSLEQIKKNTEVSRMAAANPYLAKIRGFNKANQLSFNDTVNVLTKERISFARFGDGELKLMLRPTYNLAFQKNSESLRAALAAVIEQGKAKPKQLLVGFPQTYQDLHWSGVWVDIADETLEHFAGIKRVGNAHVTRPIFFEDLARLHGELESTSEELYLIALGPAGTVLAAELAAKGKWAIDLGHISDSYENVFKGAVRPELKPVAKS
jgi:hypothetical protein